MDLAHPAHRPRLDALAAQYALGTLRGPARERLARAARRQPVIAAAIQRWERRLAGLTAAVPCANPSPRLWLALAGRLGLSIADDRLAWWQRLGFWRGFAIASFVAALLLSALEVSRAPEVSPPLLAVLRDAQGQPAMIVQRTGDPPVLRVEALTRDLPGADQVYELWALPRSGMPRALGQVAPRTTTRLALTPQIEARLADVRDLAISRQPAGAAPPMPGPLLYRGAVALQP